MSVIKVFCPKCGQAFALDEKLSGALERQWRDRERVVVRRELDKEYAAKAEARAAKLAEAKVRDATEQVREANKRAGTLQAKVTKLEKEVNKPSRAQALGTERERTAAEMLCAQFHSDTITLERKGVAGADITQQVARSEGGSILWEIKRAANWNSGWLTKLAAERKRGNHTEAVLVVEVLPTGATSIDRTEQGLWICTIEMVLPLATCLRYSMVETATAREAGLQRDDLKAQIYDYVLSPKFLERIESMLAAEQQLRAGIDKGRGAITRLFNEWERHCVSIRGELSMIYGDLCGIGAPMAGIGGMELEAG
jgi:hypothetical protein